MPIKKRHLKLLEPYLVGEEPTMRGSEENGNLHREYDMYCPLHPDGKRSATLDIDRGLYFCQATCGGGRVADLIAVRDKWIPMNHPERAIVNSNGSRKNGSSNGNTSETITEAKIRGWASNLLSSPEALEKLVERRGLDEDIITAYEIGWDSAKKCYCFPIRDENGEIKNLRRYQFDPPDGRRKMWSIKGMGSPARLYPIDILVDDNPDTVIVCEGEWDALLTIQNGFAAVTRTSSAKTWDAGWGDYFRDKTVYLIHDMDKAGKQANEKIAKMLAPAAKEVRCIELPYEFQEKHGKDLSDYWLDGHTAEEFEELLHSSHPASEDKLKEESEPEEVSLSDSFDAKRSGQPMKIRATIKGKAEPGYVIPSKFDLSCSRDKGAVCQICPMNAAGGESEYVVHPDDPVVLELVESTAGQVVVAASREFGVPGGKCSRLDVEVKERQPVEILFARPAVDSSDVSDAYKTVKLTAVGKHNTAPNATYRVVGSLYPNPRNQQNEFLAWSVEPVQTGLDTFEITTKEAEKLKKFRPRKGQRPLNRLGYIAHDLTDHVTHIYGRPQMHAAMDLIFHSVISFYFGGQRVERGWLEGIFVGDTRTGKSEAASRLVGHYRAGEVVSCESASFAGIIGGLEQHGSKAWSISWGVVPLNDRRLVVLDEVSGLEPKEIASMSDVRSRGIAQLTKIQTDATHARTRLIWVGNPRDGGMDQYTYGAQALKPLIGNPEDIARFDMAMSAQANDVPSEVMNAAHDYDKEGGPEFDSELCSLLIRWVWSRRPDQVMWAKGAEEAVREAAVDLGRRYVSDPPLIQAANARIKIARVAVALAARLFSTDETYEKVQVRKEHVWDAVAFLEKIYSMPGFGYEEMSRRATARRQEAMAHRKEALRWLVGRQGMSTFLRENPSFRRQDLEEYLNVSRDDANAIINRLYDWRMIRREKGNAIVEPVLHELIREVER